MEYIVNVGNIGNIEEKTRAEANTTFAEYVAMSKGLRCSRGQQEDVYLLANGEPVREFIFTVWKIGKLRKIFDRLQSQADKAMQVLEDYKLSVSKED